MDQQSMKVSEEKSNSETNDDAAKKASHRGLRRIKDQMEFYFSDANLQKDRLLGKLVKENGHGYVDLSLFTTFNKIRAYTTNVEDIKKALRYSHVLELSDDGNRVHRKIPFVPFEDEKIDERTIYVERIPQDADDVYVRNLFKQFGTVTYIGLPRFRKTRKLKGFAFVEFELVESVQKACEFYKLQNQEQETESETTDQEGKKVEGKKKKSSDSHSSHKLFKKRRRIEKEKTPEKGLRRASDTDRRLGSRSAKVHRHEKYLHRKRKRLSSESEKASKKLKVGESSEGPLPKPEVDSSSADEGAAKAPKPEGEIKDSEDSDGLLPSKRARVSEDEAEIAESCTSASSKEKDVKSEVSESNEELGTNTDAETREVEQEKKKCRKKRKKSGSGKLKLRVMTKTEWKSYRNKYLALQKKAISRLKKMLLLDRQQKNECDAMLSRSAEKTTDDCSSPSKSNKKGVTDEFQPNVVIKIMLDKAPESVQTFINEVRSSGDVAYVDATDPQVAYVRFRNCDSAAKCLEERKLNHLGACTLVTGEAEKEYWEKIKKVKEEIRNRPRPKKRGRDKILARAEKMLEKEKTHIHFKV